MTTLTSEGVVQLARQCFKDEGIKVPEATRPDGIRLIGDGAVCDSVALVGFLVALEERVARDTGVAVSLMDERAMSQTRSPFRNLATLAEFVVVLASASA